jgi:hypothetical protein
MPVGATGGKGVTKNKIADRADRKPSISLSNTCSILRDGLRASNGAAALLQCCHTSTRIRINQLNRLFGPLSEFLVLFHIVFKVCHQCLYRLMRNPKCSLLPPHVAHQAYLIPRKLKQSTRGLSIPTPRMQATIYVIRRRVRKRTLRSCRNATNLATRNFLFMQ